MPVGAFLFRRSLHSLFALVGADRPRLLPGAADRQPGRPLSCRSTPRWRPGPEFAARHGSRPAAHRAVRQLPRRAWPSSISASRSARTRPALDVVLEAMPMTLALAAVTMTLAIVRLHPRGLARRLASGRGLRPDRQHRLAGRRQRPRLLARDQRHPALRGHAGLAADLGHGRARHLDHADRRPRRSGRSASWSRWCATR